MYWPNPFDPEHAVANNSVTRRGILVVAFVIVRQRVQWRQSVVTTTKNPVFNNDVYESDT